MVEIDFHGTGRRRALHDGLLLSSPNLQRRISVPGRRVLHFGSALMLLSSLRLTAYLLGAHGRV